jgi:hypothetical protein
MEARERRMLLWGGCLVLAVAPALLLSVEPLLQNGDSAVYNEQIEHHVLADRTPHIGYMTLGVIFRTLLPGSTDSAMNAMTVLLGVAGLLAVYFTSYRLSRSVIASLIATATVLSIKAYLRGMLLSEVDVPLAAFVSIAFAFWIAARPIAAGLVFGFAMLISPLASLALPAFLISPGVSTDGEPVGPRRWFAFQSLVRFAAASSLVYLPVVLANSHEYLFAHRGVLRARVPIPLHAKARNSWNFVTDNQLAPLLLFYAAGVVVGIRRRLSGVMAGLLLVPIASLVLGENFGHSVPVQLTAAALLAPCLALAAVAKPRLLGACIAGALCLAIAHNGWDAQAKVRAEMARIAKARATYLAIREASPRPPVVVDVIGFSDVRRAEWVLYGKTKNGLVMPRNKFVSRCEVLANDPEARPIWFLRAVHKAPCPALMARYHWKKMRAAGKRYMVLVPRET